MVAHPSMGEGLPKGAILPLPLVLKAEQGNRRVQALG